MQDTHHGDHHHPPRLTRARALALALVLLTAVPVASAAPPRYTALPSPTAPLSASPPLSGGAAASAEGIRHRIAARTSVRVSVDPSGRPFAVDAVQTLHVRVQGDYFFTIGAPVLSARAGPGSHSPPGVRSTSILWAGFNPGRRTLAAAITLDPRVASAALPLRIDAHAGHVTLTNRTVLSVLSYGGEVAVGPLRRYARRFAADIAAGRTVTPGGVLLTSPPRSASFRAVAMLHVTGTIGGRPIDLVLSAKRVTLAAHGAIRLRIEPTPPLALLRGLTALPGDALLRRVSAATFDLARTRQYATYLGNPDPIGTNTTTYTYRSAARPVLVAAPTARTSRGGGALGTFLVLGGVLAALAVGVAIWARS